MNAVMPDDAQPYDRLPAVDAMRGLVMVLMTADHASFAFNAGRYVTDSVAWYSAGSAIPAVQFLVRWVTHVCAPTFVFLAGLAMAFSIARRHEAGFSDRRIDIDLLIRGLFLMALDPLWMSFGFGGRTVFQVLYTIGGGLCCMALLRSLDTAALLIFGGVLMLGSEILAGVAILAGDGKAAGPVGAFLAAGGRLGDFGYVIYPLLPWLAYMILGMGCGRLLLQNQIRNPARWFATAGTALLVLFFIVRGLNGYGNMLLYRDDMSLLQWLHVSKYPPSLSFASMTLGIMCLGLALFFHVYTKDRGFDKNPLLVFGRVPLFFYLLHVHLLSGSAKLLGMWKAGGLFETFIAAGVALIVLYPLCWWYAVLKRKRRNSVLRYI
jgi:uncharacterized membrane protein